MTEELLDLFDRVSLVDQKAACGVAEIMKANVRKIVLLQNLREAVTHIVRLEGCPVRTLTDMLVIGKGTPGNSSLFRLRMLYLL